MQSIISKYSQIPFKFKFEYQQFDDDNEMIMLEILVEDRDAKVDLLAKLSTLFNPEHSSELKCFKTNHDLIGGDIGVYSGNKSLYLFLNKMTLDLSLSIINNNLSKIERVYALKQWQSYSVSELNDGDKEVADYLTSLMIGHCKKRFSLNQRFNSSQIPMEKILLDMIDAPSDQIYRGAITYKNQSYHQNLIDVKHNLLNNLVVINKLKSDHNLFYI